jgi:hypothetical protein
LKPEPRDTKRITVAEEHGHIPCLLLEVQEDRLSLRERVLEAVREKRARGGRRGILTRSVVFVEAAGNDSHERRAKKHNEG